MTARFYWRDEINAQLIERDALATELAKVKAQLLVVQAERDTALAESAYYRTHYTRSGW
jgi:hypothetical protein